MLVWQQRVGTNWGKLPRLGSNNSVGHLKILLPCLQFHYMVLGVSLLTWVLVFIGLPWSVVLVGVGLILGHGLVVVHNMLFVGPGFHISPEVLLRVVLSHDEFLLVLLEVLGWPVNLMAWAAE